MGYGTIQYPLQFFFLEKSVIAFFIFITTINANPYFVANDLGAFNPEAAFGNPLKGFLTKPEWNSEEDLLSFPSTLEMYSIGLNEVMIDFNTFDWETHLEARLNDSASRLSHAILRFVLDTPSEDTQVPQFLIDAGLDFNSYDAHSGGQSPNYNDENLHLALQQFIQAFGESYDGDSRIGFIQVGLLGFWGEWHTYTDGLGNTEYWIPDSLKSDVISWFNVAFNDTPLQVRVPHPSAVDAGFGLHDDSFSFSTLDGEYNGGEIVPWFFWPSVEAQNYASFWQSQVMGGEIYPPLQPSIFADSYPANTSFHQDFTACANNTHATYMLNNAAFNSQYQGADLEYALYAHNHMGYEFQLTHVEVAESVVEQYVDITVEVLQTGIAPFYYPLSLTMSCSLEADTDNIMTEYKPGLEAILPGHTETFTFLNVPATESCLNEIEFALFSSQVYSNNPVKFAQGNNGAFVTVNQIPMPPTTSSSSSPTVSPIDSSSSSPTVSPTDSSSATCENTSLRFKITKSNGKKIMRGCAWVANKPYNRCTFDGVSSACPSSCDTCDVCEDSSLRFKITKSNGRKIMRDCLWVSNIPDNRCTFDGVAEACRDTCEVC